LSSIVYYRCIEKLVNDLRIHIAVNCTNRFLIKDTKCLVKCLIAVVDLKKEHFKENLDLKIKSTASELSHINKEELESIKIMHNFYIDLLSDT
jgi:hypothetical protein